MNNIFYFPDSPEKMCRRSQAEKKLEQTMKKVQKNMGDFYTGLNGKPSRYFEEACRIARDNHSPDGAA